MADIKKVNIKGTIYDVHDIEARENIKELKTRISSLESSGGGSNVTVSGGKGLSYIYINTPSDAELEREDFVLVEIDLANNEDFSDKVSFALTDCWVFNPATGIWEVPSASGLSLSYCNSMLRLKYPESSYTLCRYRWKYTDNSYIKGSYNIALI
jgi:hypothetical protein